MGDDRQLQSMVVDRPPLIVRERAREAPEQPTQHTLHGSPETTMRRRRELGRRLAPSQSGEAGRYIGGGKPSLPTASRAAFRLPAASFVSVTRGFAPPFASGLGPAL